MACPGPELLSALHHGERVDATVRAHVDDCPTCAQALMRLTFEGGTQATSNVDGPPPDPTAVERLAIGSRIGRYVVLSELGSGGMGVVYAAHDPELNRKVAIKLLQVSASETLHTTAAQARLVSEAQAMAKLAHPHVVSVFDVGMLEDRVFVAMEFVDGQTLRDWLAEKPRSQAEVRVAMLEAARGLAAAHQVGLVHRDFKPDNVLVGKDGRVRVMDFGIAQAIDPAAEDTGDQREQKVEGTPAYLAPEQLEGAKANELSDQFSFGVTLYEALYGARPFAGHPARRDPATRWVLQPARKDVAVSPALRRIALQALSVDPSQRFPTMSALIDALAVDPVARRRNRALGAVAVLSVAAIVGAYQWRLSESRQVCRGFEAKPARLFDPARRDTIRATFNATGKSYAEDSYTRTEKLLEGYATDWASARTEACEATRLRAEQPEEVLSLRMICLDRRLEEWSALIDLLGRADGELVQQSVKAALSLTPLNGCADIAALKAPVPPPTDPEVVARIDELRGPLAEVKALMDAGKYVEAEQKVTPLVKRALATNYAPIASEALYFEGLSKNKRNLDGAGNLLREAFTQAILARDDARAVQASTQLVRDLWERGNFPQSEDWARVGLALSARAEHGKFLHAGMLQQVAGMYWRRGEMEEARRLLDQASAEMEGQPGADALRGAILTARALVLDQTGDYQTALKLHAQAAEVQARLYGPEHPSPLSVQMNWTIALVGAGQPQKAIEVGERNLAAMEKTLGPSDPNTLGQVLCLAEAWLLLGEVEKAYALARRGTDEHVRVLGAEHPRTAVAYASLAETLVARGEVPEAISLSQRGLKILDAKIGQHGFVTLVILNSLGNSLLAGDRAAEALPMFERALKIAEEQKLMRVDRAVSQLGVARALTQLNRDPKRAQELAQLAEPKLEQFARTNLAKKAKELLAAR